ncbi:hypothetical protein [Methylorubrum aminovorans]
MAALFVQPSLAATQTEQRPMLPPGGPIFKGLQMLHKAGLLKITPSGSEMDDQVFEPGSLYDNSQHLADICAGLPGWSLINVRSGVFVLGTRHPHSDKRAWF